MNILITAFEPFDGQQINSSYEIVSKINFTSKDVQMIKITLPVVYDKDLYFKLLNDYQPDYLLLCGQAANRKMISLEQVGLNFMYANIPDNSGVLKRGEKIIQEGPDALFSTIDFMPFLNSIENTKLPVELSLTAGAYICNLALYTSLYFAKISSLNTKIGFIHFPLLESQTEGNNKPAISLKTGVLVLEKLLKYLSEKE
ncbi:MAG: pyroglutamyl-peptidase I [Firmicutes bacterium]|nr:pyroglutamyl-peptidase I [Bacillota bacterium]